MPKGNKSPVNNILIRATAELLELINSLPNPKGLPHFQIVARDFVEAHKKEFIAKFGKDVYEDHMKRYNRSPTELKNDRLEKDRKYLQKLEERKILKERELAIKEKELNIRKENSELRKEKLDIENPSEVQKLENQFLTINDPARKTILLNQIRELDPERAKKLESEPIEKPTKKPESVKVFTDSEEQKKAKQKQEREYEKKLRDPEFFVKKFKEAKTLEEKERAIGFIRELDSKKATELERELENE